MSSPETVGPWKHNNADLVLDNIWDVPVGTIKLSAHLLANFVRSLQKDKPAQPNFLAGKTKFFIAARFTNIIKKYWRKFQK